VIACSDWVSKELRKSGIDSLRIYLPVPAPSEKYLRSRADDPVILYCGRLDTEKGVDRLFHAFARVAASNSEVTLRIAGQGPEKTRLEELARELGIDKRIVFLGWQGPRDIESELSRAWTLVAPSLWAEPLGLVALEAAVRGVPVIASEVGGFAETVEEGVTGLLVPNGDVSALAEAMSSVVTQRKFSDGIPDDVIRRVAARHDVALHIQAIRTTLSEIVPRQEQAPAQ
jgi:glycosyltransferase involved in cell wall biosynthesis